MCRCHYNYGIELRGDKQDVMDYIPKEVLTPKFLLGLLRENPNNFARFNEHALETEIRHTVDGESVKEKIWKSRKRRAEIPPRIRIDQTVPYLSLRR